MCAHPAAKFPRYGLWFWKDDGYRGFLLESSAECLRDDFVRGFFTGTGFFVGLPGNAFDFGFDWRGPEGLSLTGFLMGGFEGFCWACFGAANFFCGSGLLTGWATAAGGLPTFGFTTNGLGPGLPLMIGCPSAVRFGPEPGGGNGVFPGGRAAA